MNTAQNPKLPLTTEERNALRSAKVKINQIAELELKTFADLLDITYDRARLLKGLASFQQIPSIGCRLSHNLVQYLGLYNLDDVRGQDPALLLDCLEIKINTPVDPCVEDQIRCVVHHAENPGSDRQWFDFTAERKRYREIHGYPASRPKPAG
ncbi:helix-hairpin-helix domain-containing protein [Sediminibacillus albus]|uniref:Pathogenicity locus n=1 Tax=Sediminibacillus albus TaxID=407036 RepID=A0A1G8WV16_9BACI|nr:helix-hairpin-helix domain-containing protein [Sediminibacillus albus]SDJ82074.1 Pathogenicity locus [Sediminibacillus albus]